MTPSGLIPILLCVAACSCTSQTQRLQFGDDRSWISEQEAGRLWEDFLRKQGYTNAYLVSETEMREKIWYAFSTNGTPPPSAVMVDRKTRKVRYGDWRRQE